MTYKTGDRVVYRTGGPSASAELERQSHGAIVEGAVGTVADPMDDLPPSMVAMALLAAGVDPTTGAWPMMVSFEGTHHPLDNNDQWALTTLDVAPAPSVDIDAFEAEFTK